MAATGITATEFYTKNKRAILGIFNESLLKLEADLVKATPANVGRLRQGWTRANATEASPKAVIGQSVGYFFPVEFGRAPGKGISAEGQQSVADWGRKVLGLDAAESKNFAFLLSQKYKKEGRPASGFAGLAPKGSVPGSSANQSDTLEPITGGLIDSAFKSIERRLDTL